MSLTQKKLKKPIRESFHSIYDYYAELIVYYFRKNKNIGLFIVIILILIISGGFYYSYLNNKNLKESTILVEAVNDKLKLFLKEYENIKNYKKTRDDIINSLTPIAKKYRSNINGKRAIYYLGMIYFIDKQYNKAIKYFDMIKDDKKFYLAPFAYYGAIISYLNSNEIDNALKYAEGFYKKFKKEVYGAYASFVLAKIYELKGDLKNAKKYYDIIQKDYNDSALAHEKTVKDYITYFEVINNLIKTTKEKNDSNK